MQLRTQCGCPPAAASSAVPIDRWTELSSCTHAHDRQVQWITDTDWMPNLLFALCITVSAARRACRQVEGAAAAGRPGLLHPAALGDCTPPDQGVGQPAHPLVSKPYVSVMINCFATMLFSCLVTGMIVPDGVRPTI